MVGLKSGLAKSPRDEKDANRPCVSVAPTLTTQGATA